MDKKKAVFTVRSIKHTANIQPRNRGCQVF